MGGWTPPTPKLRRRSVPDHQNQIRLADGGQAVGDEEGGAVLQQVVEAVSADQVVAKLEQGWDSNVGEEGDRLSTGEKQLISFARAVLADPRIFVLDEATSSIDTLPAIF